MITYFHQDTPRFCTATKVFYYIVIRIICHISTIAMVTLHTVGGVIEDNEVFGNKFDGICLATGVNPKLKGEL